MNDISLIWKVEGVTDALALFAKIPPELRDTHLVFTNSNGAGERPAEWILDLIGGIDTGVVHDADIPGQQGAMYQPSDRPEQKARPGWAPMIATRATKDSSVKHVRLPYPVVETHGRDLRDWLNEGHTYLDLRAMAMDPAYSETVLPPPGWDRSDESAVSSEEPEFDEPYTEDPKTPDVEYAAALMNAITYNAETTPISTLMRDITETLLQTGRFYCRAGQPSWIQDGEIKAIGTAELLAAIVNSLKEFVVIIGTGEDVTTRFEPLPPRYGLTWLMHPVEVPRLLPIMLFTKNPIYTGGFDLVKPGYDIQTGIYYSGPRIDPQDATEFIQKLLNEFCWKTPSDRTNYLGMLLTCLLVSKFIGAKPGVLFNGNQPGLGKTILAQIIAIIRDGKVVPTCSYTDKDDDVEKRLGSVVKSGITTIIVDNAKGRKGRAAMIDSAVIERSITDKILSFRLLGQSLDITCENSHIFCITANSPEVSRDIMSRCVPVNLHHSGDPDARTFLIQDPEGYATENREQILGELLGMVERWKAAGMPLANVNTRFKTTGWGNIIGGILELNGELGFMANAKEASREMDPMHGDFVDLLERMAKQGMGKKWTPTEIVELANQANLYASDIGEKSGRSERAKSSFIGKMLPRFLKTEFEILDDKRVMLQMRSSGHNKTYTIEPVSVLSIEEGGQASDVDQEEREFLDAVDSVQKGQDVQSNDSF